MSLGVHAYGPPTNYHHSWSSASHNALVPQANFVGFFFLKKSNPNIIKRAMAT